MGSIQMPTNLTSSALPESSCGYLLQELKLIWDEVGQDQLERERILLELEQECMEVYRKKVDSANVSRIRLHQALADSEAEFTNLLLSLGERSFPGRPEKVTGTLKEQLDSITPALREMQQRKEGRVNQLRQVQTQIQKISSEIVGHSESEDIVVNESDLSLKKLEEYQNELQRLRKEKSDRLRKVKEYITVANQLAATMGMDSSKIISDVHPSLDSSSGDASTNISDAILDKLKNTVEQLKDEKQKRTEKLHRLGKALTNLWNLMDIPSADQRPFIHVKIYSLTGSAADELSSQSLRLELIEQVESEVKRLDQLKASKMKELFLKKLKELEEICQQTHMEIPSKSDMDDIMNFIASGEMDHGDLIQNMEEHISKAKEEARSRRDIMGKVEKWMISCNEERWLEEYNRDENRYAVSRGAHKNLKRAERARITVKKIPALVDSLIIKTQTWEEERKKVFLYDEVPLLAMLEEYTSLRQEKEEEKNRQRERKKVQSQAVSEQENLLSSMPSTSSRRLSTRSLNGIFASTYPLNKKMLSSANQPGSNNTTTRGTNFNNEGKKTRMQKMLWNQAHASQFKEDTASVISAIFTGTSSP